VTTNDDNDDSATFPGTVQAGAFCRPALCSISLRALCSNSLNAVPQMSSTLVQAWKHKTGDFEPYAFLMQFGASAHTLAAGRVRRASTFCAASAAATWQAIWSWLSMTFLNTFRA